MQEIDGHDFEQILKALDQAEATKGRPSFIVAHTVKGKGVPWMENNPEWHGKAPKPAEAIRAIRDLLGVSEAAWDEYLTRTARPGPSSTSSPRSTRSKEQSCQPKPSRAAFGEALLDLGAKDPRIVTLDADLSKSTMTVAFAKKYPGPRLQPGHRRGEHDRRGAGLAMAGKVPFVCLVRVLPRRPLRDDPHLGRLHQRQREARGHALGIAIGEDGYSQMGLEDIACMRALPNIPIIQPADEVETKQVIAYAVEHQGPLYLRLTRQNLEPVSPAGYRFRFGQVAAAARGHDVTDDRDGRHRVQRARGREAARGGRHLTPR